MSRKKQTRELYSSFVLAYEERAHFIGSIAECAAYAKGYNDHADLHAEVMDFEILPADQVVIRP